VRSDLERERLIGLLHSALDALEAGNETDYKRQLDAIAQWRSQPVFEQLARLARELGEALGALPTADPALAELPDACARLDHVIKMTEEATHRTLDLVERSRTVVDELSNGSLGPEDAEKVAELRRNLGDVALAQSFQDLTGQVIRRAVDIVSRVQQTLAHCGLDGRNAAAARELEGPALKGLDRHAVTQGDADDLLSDLGL
jgi:chemotaxis protein CheZ